MYGIRKLQPAAGDNTMLNDLRGFLNYIGRRADAQLQREAMIDLMIWTMYADKLLSLPENEKIDQMTEEMEWKSPTPPSQYVMIAISKIRDVLEDEAKAAEEMDSIYERLGTDDMRRDAYTVCRDLARADGEVADEEVNFLNTIKQRFDLVEN